jgi:hypothetical protein
MARVSLAHSVYGKGPDGCDRNFVSVGLDEGHCGGGEEEGRVETGTDGRLFIGD